MAKVYWVQPYRRFLGYQKDVLSSCPYNICSRNCAPPVGPLSLAENTYLQADCLASPHAPHLGSLNWLRIHEENHKWTFADFNQCTSVLTPQNLKVDLVSFKDDCQTWQLLLLSEDFVNQYKPACQGWINRCPKISIDVLKLRVLRKTERK